MSDLIDRTPRRSPVPVVADCPECGGDAETSAFAARNTDELPSLSVWCIDCGYGWNTDTEIDR